MLDNNLEIVKISKIIITIKISVSDISNESIKANNKK